MPPRSRPIVVSRPKAATGPGDRVDVRVQEVSPEEVRVELPDGRTGVAEAREFDRPPTASSTASVTILMTDPATGLVHVTAAEPVESVDRKAPPIGAIAVGNVTEMNRAGLAIDLGGTRAFLPLAQIARDLEAVPAEFQRRRVAAEIKGVDAKRREVTLTLRRRLDRREDRQKRQAMQRLESGTVVEGKVVRMNQHGAFIDVGGVDGLLHESRLLRHVRESEQPQKIEVGEFVKVEILHVDTDRGRVALAMPREESEEATTFSDLIEEYAVGESVTGLIQDVVDDGCSVLLDEKVKGWLPREHFDAAGGQVRRGSILQAAVDEIDLERQRVQLRPRD